MYRMQRALCRLECLDDSTTAKGNEVAISAERLLIVASQVAACGASMLRCVKRDQEKWQTVLHGHESCGTAQTRRTRWGDSQRLQGSFGSRDWPAAKRVHLGLFRCLARAAG